MDVLSDDAYKKVLYGLLGIPCLEQRELMLPIAKKWLKEYEEGYLQMSEKQFLSLKKCIEP